MRLSTNSSFEERCRLHGVMPAAMLRCFTLRQPQWDQLPCSQAMFVQEHRLVNSLQ